MTRDDLLKIARTAGIRIIDISSDTNTLTGSLVTFANLIAKIEREECAKMCDSKVDAEYKTGKVDHNEMGWTQACALAIRARGEK